MNLITSILVGTAILARPVAAGQQPTQEALQKLMYFCAGKFGFNYARTEPNDSFAEGPTTELKHDRRLIALEESIKNRVEKSSDGGERVVDNLLEDLAEKPADTERLFKLAFACTAVSRHDPERFTSFWQASTHGSWNRVLTWMLSVPPEEGFVQHGGAHCYEWVRLRFIVQGAVHDHPKLADLGRRLLEMKRDDFEVTRTQIVVLDSTSQDEATKEAVRLCDEALERWPKCITFVGGKAVAYEVRWMRLGKQRADAEKSVKYWEEAIALLPDHSPLAAVYHRPLDDLKEQLKTYSVRGK